MEKNIKVKKNWRSFKMSDIISILKTFLPNHLCSDSLKSTPICGFTSSILW